MGVIDDGLPGWLRDCHAIEVDVDGLREFARTVDAQLRANLRPHTATLLDSYAQGVTFGAANPSGDLHLAKQRYEQCLASVTRQLAAYVAAAEAIVVAADAVAQRYQQVDALSAARATDAGRALALAADTGPAAAPEPGPLAVPAATEGYR